VKIAVIVAICLIIASFSFIPQQLVDKNSIALKIHEDTNNERIKAGLHELQYNPQLAKVAEGHSDDIAQRNYFDHVTPEGLEPVHRARNAGVKCEVGENIFTVELWGNRDRLAYRAMSGWMDSEEHKANILQENYMQEGIGIAFNFWGVAYVTQNFC